MKTIELTGMKFGRWTVIKKVKSNKNIAVWECVCECGTIKNVGSHYLRNGNSKSCGCYNREVAILSNTTHGKTYTRLYSTWCKMKGRCTNPKLKVFKYYGGRGITIYEEWFKFEKFYEWALSNGYNDTLTIERKDNNGNYEPENCCWIPQSEQTKNRTNTVYIEGLCLAEFCRLHNIKYKYAYKKYSERKNPDDVAVLKRV